MLEKRFQNMKGYGAILSHLTLSIPETMPKSSGGKESSDSSTSKAALKCNNKKTKRGMRSKSDLVFCSLEAAPKRNDSPILTIPLFAELIF